MWACDAKEQTRYHRKAIVVQAPDQATVDEKFVEFPGGMEWGLGSHPQLFPEPPIPHR
jgi:hypothetical protein